MLNNTVLKQLAETPINFFNTTMVTTTFCFRVQTLTFALKKENLHESDIINPAQQHRCRSVQHGAGLCRVDACASGVFAENWTTFAPYMSWPLFWSELRGALTFDTSGLLYVNSLYLVLMLLPLHTKERKNHSIAHCDGFLWSPTLWRWPPAWPTPSISNTQAAEAR